MNRFFPALIAFAILTGCAGQPSTPLPVLTPTELKYRVLAAFPDFFFCDPDYYPVAIADETELARERFAEIQANPQEFQAILNHNGLNVATSFTDEQKLLIYREHKKLAAILFEPVGDDFQFQIQTGSEGSSGSIVTARIDRSGRIDIQQREPGFPTCPICLAENTLIDTPQGAMPVQGLKPGDLVWTLSTDGLQVAAPILRVVRVAVPANHQVVHIVLDDQRELWASPGHPTADGQRLGDLITGDVLDGSKIIFVERLNYEAGFTYDLLPAGDTGFYWANGILIGSTLMK